MKHVAIVIDSLTGGGAEKIVLTLANAMVEMGHKVTILSLSSNYDYILPEDVKIDFLFKGRASKVDRYWKVKNSINKLEKWFYETQQLSGKYDLILSNLDKSNNLLAKSTLKNNNNLFFIVHNSIEEELIRQKKLGPIAYYYLKSSKNNLSGKNLITVSKGLEKEIMQNSKIKPKSIRTIYNPFDFSVIQEQSNIANHNIPETPYIIHVGRMARQKRHDILFQAFKKVDHQYKLVLLCNKPQKAIKLAKRYGIEERLILPGFQTNPYNWIKHAEILVLSSDYEGFGNVLVEALAVGTKVVSTNCSHGPNEILKDEHSNFLVPRRNANALSKALDSSLATHLLNNDLDILANVSAENIAKQYISLCK